MSKLEEDEQPIISSEELSNGSEEDEEGNLEEGLLEDETASDGSENDSPPKKRKKRSEGRNKDTSSFRHSKRSSSGKKKSSKNRAYNNVNAFLDVEALVGEDDEEDEGEYYEDIYQEESEYASNAAEIGARRRADLERDDNMGRRHLGGAGHLEEAIAQLERRYEQKEGEVSEFERETEMGSSEVTSSMQACDVLPTSRDPKLWLVKVDRAGLEKDICIALVQKAAECQKQGKELPILSAYVASSYRGYIYVEAEAPNFVNEALQGFTGVRLSSIKIIPVKEMTRVFSVDMQEKEQLMRESWVRVRSGIYGGDLAQIYEVDEHEANVILRLVPRLDIPALIRKSQNSQDVTFSKSRIRPPAKLFDRDKVESLGGVVELTHLRGTVKFANQLFEQEKGYLLKKMKANRLVVGDAVQPTIEEIKRFFGVSDLSEVNIDSKTLLKTQKSTSFFVGDTVTITKGELIGIKAKVVAVNSGINKSLEVLPIDKSLGITEPILTQIDLVCKSFEIGDSVQIIEGVNEGESGLITSFDQNYTMAIVYPLNGTQPIRCPTNYLKKVSQDIVVTSGLSTVDGFSLDDLVQLYNGKVGVIVFVGRNKNLRLLATTGESISIKSSEISSKRNTSLMHRIPDRNGNIFGVKSTVQILEGANAGKSGKVEHIWKSTCFIKLPSKLDDSGYFTCEGRQLLAIKTGDNSRLDAATKSENSNKKGNSGAKNSGGGSGRVYGMGLHSNRRGGPDDVFINQKVRILRGKHKALLGSIRGFKGNNVEVLLDIGPHTVLLRREDIVLVGTTIGNSQASSFGGLAKQMNTHPVSQMKQPNWTGGKELSQQNPDHSVDNSNHPPLFCRRGVEVTVVSQGEFFNQKGIISDILFPPEVPQVTCYIILIINGQICPDEMIAIAPQSISPNKPIPGENSISVSPQTGVFTGIIDSVEGDDFLIMDSNRQSTTKVSGQFVFKYHTPPE
ncbi:SPT5-like transcription initiation factor [Cryptosporidium ubiquitum]|uniref:Transcription elongation factor SPT5 n=1 Tax=Cryptosporidium ubiquitum TaxID=857276 RepID=A0A1J4MH97_9CRYT|nr:SPT5-like transcription initiation factor [Cryptosporidium ubiquitum]OII73383.1 SPT5-like transcription initiation factor [Cryptosporidium ubiquitum]